jgi:hypothetical protein
VSVAKSLPIPVPLTIVALGSAPLPSFLNVNGMVESL